MSLKERLLQPIKNTEYGYLLDFVSPEFFKVLSFKDLSKQMATLSKNLVSLKEFESQKAKLNDLFFKSKTQNLEELTLRLYFYQILYENTVLLDLRESAFLTKKNKVQSWNPKPIWIKWPQSFSKNIRNIYIGYYTQNHQLFESALKELNLESAKDLFIKHFGGFDTKTHKFVMQDFIKSFHEIFEHCKKQKIQLDGHFLSLGIYLATLYENLAKQDKAQPVQKIFTKVYSW